MIKQKGGGRFLGEGDTGCFYHPLIKCNIKQYKNGVSKVVYDVENAKIEYEISSYITSQIDPKGSFTNPFIDSCDINSLHDIGEHQFCKPIKKKIPPYVQLIYKYPGINLDKYSRTNRFDLSVVNGLLNVAKGIKQLMKHNIHHMNIKPEHLLFIDTKNAGDALTHNKYVPNKKMILIDFNSFTTTEFLYKNYMISPHIGEFNPMMAPEFKLYTMFANHLEGHGRANYIDFTDILEDGFADINGKLHKWYEQYDKHNVNKVTNINNLTTIYQEADEIVNDYVDFIMFASDTIQKKVTINDEFSMTENLQILSNFFTKYANKIDIFSFGMTILEIFNNSTASKKHEFDERILMYLDDVIYQSTRFDPRKRCSIDYVIDALKNMKSLLKEDDAQYKFPVKMKKAAKGSYVSFFKRANDDILDEYIFTNGLIKQESKEPSPKTNTLLTKNLYTKYTDMKTGTPKSNMYDLSKLRSMNKIIDGTKIKSKSLKKNSPSDKNISIDSKELYVDENGDYFPINTDIAAKKSLKHWVKLTRNSKQSASDNAKVTTKKPQTIKEELISPEKKKIDFKKMIKSTLGKRLIKSQKNTTKDNFRYHANNK